MKALFVTKYGEKGASSRLRALQYLPSLRARGWTVDVAPLFPDSYLDSLYGAGGRGWFASYSAIAGRVARLRGGLLRRYDAVFLQYEFIPFAPFVFERGYLRANPKLVVDYDDATQERYRGIPGMRDKIANVIRSAREVIAGNRTLFDFASALHPKVSLIPTVVDLDRYPVAAAKEADGRKLVVGWIGTPVTAKFLYGVREALARLARERDFVLRCIGTRPDFALPGVPVENCAWSVESEARLLGGLDAGIMPLDDEPFSRGKCGFKLIQYMASGIPALGSAIGANRDIISDGENGLLADGEGEFYRKLDLLLSDAALRRRLGAAGRRTVEQGYSLQTQSPRFCEVLERVAA